MEYIRMRHIPHKGEKNKLPKRNGETACGASGANLEGTQVQNLGTSAQIFGNLCAKKMDTSRQTKKILVRKQKRLRCKREPRAQKFGHREPKKKVRERKICGMGVMNSSAFIVPLERVSVSRIQKKSSSQRITREKNKHRFTDANASQWYQIILE